jgi:hypothetical protein
MWFHNSSILQVLNFKEEQHYKSPRALSNLSPVKSDSCAKKWSPPKGRLVAYLCCCSAQQQHREQNGAASATAAATTTTRVSTVDATKWRLSKKELKWLKMAARSGQQDQPVKRGAVAIASDNG